METLVKTRYELKQVGALGAVPRCYRELAFLNRIARNEEVDGGLCFKVDSDPRRRVIVIEEMSLTNGKAVDMPEVKAKDG